jgi:hypothetical protein
MDVLVVQTPPNPFYSTLVQQMKNVSIPSRKSNQQNAAFPFMKKESILHFHTPPPMKLSIPFDWNRGGANIRGLTAKIPFYSIIPQFHSILIPFGIYSNTIPMQFHYSIQTNSPYLHK